MMAREIQSQSNRSHGGKAVLRQLGNAIFWLVVAIAVPVEEFLRPIPDVAPYAHWAPILFYALAFWSFIRAIRSLQRVAASRLWTPRIRVAGGSPPAQAAGGKRARTGSGVAMTRPPTVQRMR
jgi:hypothetical protein